AGISAGVNHERERRDRPLEKGFVHFGFVACCLRKRLHVTHHSDNLAPFPISAGDIHANLLAKWLLAVEVAVNKFLVDDHDAPHGAVVHFVEKPAAEQRDGGGVKELAGHDRIDNRSLLGVREFRLVLDLEGELARARRGQIGSGGNRLSAWSLLEARNYLLNELRLLQRLFVVSIVESDIRSEEMIGPEAEILVSRDKDPANQNAGADQQGESQRNFAGDQNGAKPSLRATGGGRTALILKTGIHIGA